MYLASKLSQVDLTKLISNTDSANWFDQFVEGLQIDTLEGIHYFWKNLLIN